MKRYKWLRAIVVAALVVGVASYATAALAASIKLGNEVVGDRDYFHIGDTIPYAELVTNINSSPASMTVTFQDPGGAITTLDPVRAWAVSETQNYYPTYVIPASQTSADIDDYAWWITSELRVMGSLANKPTDKINASITKAVGLLIPGISVDTAVDFNNDGTFSEAETYYAGSPATWQILVTNTGNCPVTVDLSDSLRHDFGPAFVLAKGATASLPYTTTSVVSSTANTVVATAVDDLGGPAGTVTAQDTATANPIAPALLVESSVDFDGDGVFSVNTESGYVGDEATWRVVVTNTGLDPISTITITDTNGHTFAPIALLAPGESMTFEYTADVYSTTNNDAKAAGTDSIGGPVTAHDDATAAVLGRRYADLRISKTADKATVDANGVVTYTVKVENVGNGAAEGLEVVDDFDERYMDVIDANGGAVSGGKITWTITGPLAADGVWTITYKLKARAEEVLPTGKTELPNVVIVTLAGGENEMEDPNPEDNTARFTVTADNPFLPFTPITPKKPANSDDPYLPFTGANGALLFVLASGAAIAGLKLRTSSRGDES